MKYNILFIIVIMKFNVNAQLFGGMIISKAAACEAVTDYDGNTYNVVDINGQCWIDENLKTTHYNDGTAIPNATNGATWAGLTTGARTYYNFDSTSYAPVYGALYNWYAVETEKLCPLGWHVPTNAEWTELETYLGGESVAGGKLKEVGTAHWLSPNEGATDEVGFTALPGGYRQASDNFTSINLVGLWWTSTIYIYNNVNSYIKAMSRNNTNVSLTWNTKNLGVSVRCLKN